MTTQQPQFPTILCAGKIEGVRWDSQWGANADSEWDGFLAQLEPFETTPPTATTIQAVITNNQHRLCQPKGVYLKDGIWHCLYTHPFPTNAPGQPKHCCDLLMQQAGVAATAPLTIHSLASLDYLVLESATPKIFYVYNDGANRSVRVPNNAAVLQRFPDPHRIGVQDALNLLGAAHATLDAHMAATASTATRKEPDTPEPQQGLLWRLFGRQKPRGVQ